MDRAQFRTPTVLCLKIAIVVGTLGAVTLFMPLGERKVQVARAVPAAMDDFAGGYGYADMAKLPSIFIGVVIRSDGEDNIAEPGYEPWLVPAYVVAVDTTLKGSTSGQIRLAVVTSDYADERGGGKVEIGKRYLFAAVDDPSGTYTIDEGFGNILISSDSQETALVAEFSQLISETSQASYGRAGTAADPCESLNQAPSMDLDPERGRAGRTVQVTVKRLVRPEVGIWWRTTDNRIGVGRVGDDCVMTETVTIPKDARPGRYEIIVIDARGVRVDKRFEVTENQCSIRDDSLGKGA